MSADRHAPRKIGTNVSGADARKSSEACGRTLNDSMNPFSHGFSAEERATYALSTPSYGCSRFCEPYRAWVGKLTPTMQQTHIAGERMFVDYAGTTIDIFDATTREVHACQSSSSLCSTRRATPMLRPRAPRRCRIGSARTRAPSRYSSASSDDGVGPP